MNLCIYSKKTDSEATFNTQEHIFPASLGGLSKLPKGYVSDEVNNKFSGELELDFTKESLVSICRQFEGPGSRGNITNSKKATRSKVHIFTNDKGRVSLGYIMMGKPYQINQIVFNLDDNNEFNGKCNLLFGEDIKSIKNELEIFMGLEPNASITIISDKEIGSNKVILGVEKYQHKGKGPMKYKWYIAHDGSLVINDSSKNLIKDYIQKIYNNTDEENLNKEVEKHQVISHQYLNFNIEKFNRTCAKIAFNYMASILGQDIVLNKEFNSIRNYIVKGGKNKFVIIDNDIKLQESKYFEFMKDTHSIIANFCESEIIVILTLYGTINIIIKVAYNISFQNLPLEFPVSGLIIDWKNRTECDLIEHVLKINKEFDYNDFIIDK